MRKIKVYLSVLVATLSLLSCSKDDDNQSSDKIIGTWGFYKYVDLDSGDEEFYDMNKLTNQETFKENGVYEYYYKDYSTGQILKVVTEWMHVEKNEYAVKEEISGQLYDAHYYIEFVSDDEIRMRQVDVFDDGFEDFNEWDYYKRVN